MSVRTAPEIAAVIRAADPTRSMPAWRLGTTVGRQVIGDGCAGCAALIGDFVKFTDPGRELDADRLAELIVAEFNLDRE